MFRLSLYLFKIIQNYCNKFNYVLRQHQPKVTVERENLGLDYLVYPSFWEINTLFVWMFESNDDRIENTRCFLPKVETKDCNIMIDEQNFFVQPVKHDRMITFEKLRLVKVIITQLAAY